MGMITNLDIFEKKWIKKDTPNWFYLVLGDDNEKKVWSSLKNMKFINLKGISDNYRISKSFFDIRDIFLIMKGSDVVNLNEVEDVEYFNPDSFCKDNLKMWRRITQNSPFFLQMKKGYKQDVSFSSALNVFFQDLKYRKTKGDRKFININDKNGIISYLEHGRVYHEIVREFDSLYHLNKLHINSFDDFVKLTYDFVKIVAGNYVLDNGYGIWDKHWKVIEDYIIQKLTIQELKKLMSKPFDYISYIYEREGEWFVNSPNLIIPRYSTLYFKKIGGERIGYASRGLEQEYINKMVQEYGLNHIYDIRTVDNHMNMIEILKKDFSNG